MNRAKNKFAADFFEQYIREVEEDIFRNTNPNVDMWLCGLSENAQKAAKKRIKDTFIELFNDVLNSEAFQKEFKDMLLREREESIYSTLCEIQMLMEKPRNAFTLSKYQKINYQILQINDSIRKLQKLLESERNDNIEVDKQIQEQQLLLDNLQQNMRSLQQNMEKNESKITVLQYLSKQPRQSAKQEEINSQLISQIAQLQKQLDEQTNVNMQPAVPSATAQQNINARLINQIERLQKQLDAQQSSNNKMKKQIDEQQKIIELLMSKS